MTVDRPMRHAIWQALRRVKWAANAVLARAGYSLSKHVETVSLLGHLLADRLEASPEPVTFVQIGANDGTSFDPLYPIIQRFPMRFRGLVVEPLRDKFDLLGRAYAGMPDITPVNAAIHATEKEMLIHRVRPDIEKRLGPWARGIASFDPDHYRRSYLNAAHMVTERVVCMSFAELVARYELPAIDLLVTDTEGYDAEILRSIDFSAHRPTYIHFEHGLQSGLVDWPTCAAVYRELMRHGYNISHEPNDATAVLPAAFSYATTSALWRG